jgi:Family of unknown function (DUF6427)
VLSLFRTNQFISNTLLVFYVLLLRGLVFFLPVEELSMSHPGILSRAVYSWIGTTGWVPNFVALLLVLLQSLLVNVIVAKYRMARTVSLYPGVFYILIVSSFPDFLHLSPVLMANTFLLLVLYELFDSYKKFTAAGSLYNIGLWLGVAALFYYAMLAFIIAAVIGFSIVRSFKMRELMMILFGLMSPYWLLGVWYFFRGHYDHFWPQAILDNVGMIQLNGTWLITYYVQLVFFGALLIIVLLQYNEYIYKVSIQAQKNINIVYWFLAVSALTLLMQRGIAMDHLLILAVPFSILVSMTLLYMDHRLSEAIHFLVVVCIILYQTEAFWSV